MDNTPRIETARLVLRRFEIGDLPAILKIFGDEAANRFLPWFPLRDLSEAEAFYRVRFAAVYERPQGYAYAICRKEDGIAWGISTRIPTRRTTLDTRWPANGGGRGLRRRRRPRSSSACGRTDCRF